MRRHSLRLRRAGPARVAGAAAGALVIVAGCTTAIREPSPAAPSASSASPRVSATTPSAGPAVEAVEVRSGPGTELEFRPGRVIVPAAGAWLRIVLVNDGEVAHNLSFTGPLLGLATRTIVEPGARDLVELPRPVPGEYEFVCSIHEGMTGSLVVGEPGRARLDGPGQARATR